MIKVVCDLSDNDIYEYCVWEGLEKPQWEHIVNSLHKQGGHAGKDICPGCKRNTLKFDYGKLR